MAQPNFVGITRDKSDRPIKPIFDSRLRSCRRGIDSNSMPEIETERTRRTPREYDALAVRWPKSRARPYTVRTQTTLIARLASLDPATAGLHREKR